jgi:phenylalanyl-tRNA synthetase alpha chain
MAQQVEQLAAQAQADLATVSTPQDVEQFRVKYLGAKGAVKALMGQLKDIPPAEKPAFGQAANKLRQDLEARLQELQASIGSGAAKKSGPAIDVTEPGLPPQLGREHVITQTIEELCDVFGRMGFDVATGPEVEDDYHNFVALNIPQTHPARDPLDNFYLSAAHADGDADNLQLLRSQTSTVQIRVMENVKPPVRVIATGRVYRPDEHDATHYSMFHQVEGLYVDRNVSMVDLKTTLIQFARAMFGEEAEVKLVPSYFPFTEPSAELYIKMQVRDRYEWVEIGGCGMVDPNVFKAVGYDPEEWTGFAFGLGIERLAMRKYGISDIRWLFENDVRFLRQF